MGLTAETAERVLFPGLDGLTAWLARYYRSRTRNDRRAARSVRCHEESTTGGCDMILLDSTRYAHLRRGIEAGLIAGVPQVLITKAEEKLFLPANEDADLGPRLISKLARWAGEPLPEDMKWLAASAFHFGYSAAWGAAYAALYRRHPVRPWVGGLLLGGVIYSISFPTWGVAVQAGVEREPRQRSWRMEAVLATAAFSFGLGTALVYDRGPRRTLRERLRARWLEARS